MFVEDRTRLLLRSYILELRVESFYRVAYDGNGTCDPCCDSKIIRQWTKLISLCGYGRVEYLMGEWSYGDKDKRRSR